MLEHVDSPDNPWSRTSFEYEIQCDACKAEWTIRTGYIVNNATHKLLENEQDKLIKMSNRLDQAVDDALNAIIEDMGFQTHKEEYLYLKSEGLTNEGPIRYPRFRRDGESSASLCNSYDKRDWVVDHLDDSGVLKQVEDFEKLIEKQRDVVELARKKDRKLMVSLRN